MLEDMTDWLLLSGGNNIEDLESVDSLNSFPNLMVRIIFLNDVSLKLPPKSINEIEKKWIRKPIFV